MENVVEARGEVAVLGAVCVVDLILDLVIGVDEIDVLLHPSGRDVTLVALLDPAVPGGVRAVDGPYVDLVALADHPDRPRPAQGAVLSQRGDLALVRLTV